MPSKNKLRGSARDQDCTVNSPVCSYDNETTVLAHFNFEGGCMGGKSSDMSAGYSCYNCHAWLDQNKPTSEDALFYKARSMVRTHQVMIKNGVIKI